jgi:hypothetical protein
MKIKFTRAPTITKAAIAAAVFTIVFLVTNSNLPPCSDAVAALNAGGCLVRQSYLHTACGWLALASLITGVVLFILKQRKASSKDQQAPLRPARSGAPRPAETTVSEVRTHGYGIGKVTASDGPSAFPGPGRASNFCTQCGTRAVAAGNFCQQGGAPVKHGTGSYPRNSVAATEAAR